MSRLQSSILEAPLRSHWHKHSRCGMAAQTLPANSRLVFSASLYFYRLSNAEKKGQTKVVGRVTGHER